MPGQGRPALSSTILHSIFAALFFFTVVSSQIPLGSKLSVEDNNSWVSSNGDFAVGFFNWSNKYCIGIRFNSMSIPPCEQTVVWVAGADLTVSDKAYFQLTSEGELLLFDPLTEVKVWTSNTSDASVESAILRNDGNLVLLNKNKDVVWQSFDTPSDTLLPGQNFSVFQVLRPPSKDSISSYYSLFMDDSGQLLLRWQTIVIYWRSQNPSQSVLRAILSSDGVLQLLDERSQSVWSVYGEDHNDSDVAFRFLRLDEDGNLRLYSWLNSSGSWRPVWQAIDNQCDVFATCGLHGICVLNVSGSNFCRCPYTSNSDSNMKCLVPYENACHSGSSMITYEHTKLYGIYPPNETIIHTSLQQCKTFCQEDSLCTAVSYDNNGSALCRIWTTRYIGGHSELSIGSISMVKTCSDPIAVLPRHPNSTISNSEDTRPNSGHKICVPCFIAVSAATVVALLLIQLGIGLYFCKRRRKLKSRSPSAHMDPSSEGCVMLSFREIREITEDFKLQIGPKMFKGALANNRSVVVKDLNKIVEERKFRSSISRIGSICHKNLVKLDGYCCESTHRLLVYEFIKHGSLDKCLENPRMCKKLTWQRRMDICLRVARAISYLHSGCREFVSHGNLKCQNVMLDDNLEARVSEYGLRALLFEPAEIGGPAETDVRDFGKVLLALITGWENVDDACEWAYKQWVASQSESIPDQRIEGGVNPDELERALRIAFWCLQDDERLRPSMGEVVNVLEGTINVDPPPPLFSADSWRLPEEDEESQQNQEHGPEIQT